MQPQSGYHTLLMLLERILENAFSRESGAARLQQVALFTLIYLMQALERPVTAARLAEMSGQADSNIAKHVKKLIDLGLVERIPALNKQGRGRAYHLVVKQNAKTKRLTKAIDKAASSRK